MVSPPCRLTRATASSWSGSQTRSSTRAEATIWIGELASAAQERELAAGMAAEVTADYQALIRESAEARSAPPGQRRRTLARLRRELRRVGARDYFPPPEREFAQQAVDGLAALVEEPVG